MTENDVGDQGPAAPDERGIGGASRGASGGVAAQESPLDAARLRAICEAVPLAIVAIDPDGRVTLWSPAAERMFAWTQEELLGRPLPVSLEGAAEDFELVREALRSERPLVGHEIVRRAADGGHIVTSVSTIPLHDAEGELIETVAVIEDLTDRRRTQRELLESEERFHTSVEDLLDAFGIYAAIRDAEGRIVDFEVEFAKGTDRISGSPGGPDAGGTLLGLLQDYETKTLFEELCRVVETGAPLASRPIVRTAADDGDPSPRAFEVRAARLGDGVVAVWEDITERVAAETDLERRNSELTVAGELAELLQAVESPDEVFGLAGDLRGTPVPRTCPARCSCGTSPAATWRRWRRGATSERSSRSSPRTTAGRSAGGGGTGA